MIVTRMQITKISHIGDGRIREKLEKVKFWDYRYIHVYRVRGKTNHVKVERRLIKKCNYKFGLKI